jgi:hypothetical protein
VKEIGKDITGAAYVILGDKDDMFRGTQAAFTRAEERRWLLSTKVSESKAMRGQR